MQPSRPAHLLCTCLAIALLGALPIQAETYQIDVTHSSVDFSIRHLVGRSKGQFREFGGTIVYDESAVEKSSVEAVIKVASVDTKNEERDIQLRSAAFFDAEQYPEITFKSTKVEKNEAGKLLMTGDMTMHGVTRSVQLPVELLGTGTNPWTNLPLSGFSTSLLLRRSDFGINSWVDKSGVLGDEVVIDILIEAAVPPPEKK